MIVDSQFSPRTRASAAGRLSWLRRSIWPVCLIVLGCMAARLCVNPWQGDWQGVYLPAARLMLVGEAIHEPGTYAYAYPPAMAFVSIPLAVLPLPWAMVGYFIANGIAGAVVFICAWRMTGGPPTNQVDRRWWMVFGLGGLLGLRFVLSPIENRQFDLIIAALLLGGCRSLQVGRFARSGLLLGAAAAMKCTPLLMLPYLLWRGRWTAALALVAAAAGLNLLPDFCCPQRSGHSYLADWDRLYLRPVADASPGDWHSDLLLNQALGAAVQRWVKLGLPTTGTELEGRHRPLEGISSRTLWLLTLGLEIALLAATAWRCGGPGKSPLLSPANPGSAGVATPWPDLRTSVECAALFCLMLLLSPMSSKAHFATLLLPSLLIARRLVERRDAIGMAVLALLLVTSPLSSKDLIGRSVANLALAWGFPMLFALTLLLAMLWLIPREVPAGGRKPVRSTRRWRTKLAAVAE